jgi:hypothetical protein
MRKVQVRQGITRGKIEASSKPKKPEGHILVFEGRHQTNLGKDIVPHVVLVLLAHGRFGCDAPHPVKRQQQPGGSESVLSQYTLVGRKVIGYGIVMKNKIDLG